MTIKLKWMRSGRLHGTVVSLLLIVLLAACGGMNHSSSARPVKSEITIMAPLHFPNPPSDEIIDEIERLTDTELKIEWVPDGIYTDKMNTALTTNSLKSATFVKYTDYILVKNAIRSGAFWEIGPYLDEYPNLSKLDRDILNQAAVDGKIYGLYTERPSSRQGIILRKDWLDKLGLDEPSTLDELYEVLWAFSNDDPDGNGLNDTFGLTDRNDLIFGAFKTLSSYFGTPNNWAIEGDKLIAEFETEAYMDTMRFMRKLYQEGLINQDFAVTSKQVQRDHFIRGAAGVYIGSMTDAQRLAEETMKVNPEAELTIVNRISGPQGFKIWSIPNYNGLYVFSRKAIADEEQLRAVLGFFDRSMDADVSNLMRYGFVNRHHVMLDDKVYLPQETYSLRVSEVNQLHTLMIADLSNPNLLPVKNYEPLTELAERLSEDNNQFLVEDPTVSLDSATYDERGSELYKIITDATFNYILGHLDDEGFLAEVERWRTSGGDKIKQEYMESYHSKQLRG
mgnify:CR=1 FL=1